MTMGVEMTSGARIDKIDSEGVDCDQISLNVNQRLSKAHLAT